MADKQTSLCYIESGDRTQYLMLHRTKKKNDENEDKWIGVGGKFEEGEDAEACMLREVREETGLTLTEYRYRGVVHFESDRWPAEDMHLFTATAYTGTIRECDEGELCWLPKRELRKKKLWEGDKLFLSLLEAGADFFHLRLRYRGEALVQAELNGERIV
ncbi:MAG: NUDIX hydrolase [Oscillospiraceae bacterium]